MSRQSFPHASEDVASPLVSPACSLDSAVLVGRRLRRVHVANHLDPEGSQPLARHLVRVNFQTSVAGHGTTPAGSGQLSLAPTIGD